MDGRSRWLEDGVVGAEEMDVRNRKIPNLWTVHQPKITEVGDDSLVEMVFSNTSETSMT